jgi:2-polyprenyl-3-methyl-5-hydroxy-6-metoxy-1,4-benzoquinol methylase
MQSTTFHAGMHVNPEDVYDAGDQCPVCLSRKERHPCYRIQSDPAIDMLACKACGACSASRMPKPEFLDRYYARYYANAPGRIAFGNPQRFVRRLAALIKPPPRGSLRILDFGGGDGSLAIALAKNFQAHVAPDIAVAIDVVDYEKPCKSTVSIVVNGHRDLNEVGGPYDVLLASAIIEHVPGAHAAIRKLVSMAASGAFMYARTPHVVPLARLVPNLDITYPAHVHDMGSEFWNNFIATFALRARLLSSRPSLVETTFLKSPVRTVLAHALKFPALAELLILGEPRVPIWKLVGGWEVILQFL